MLTESTCSELGMAGTGPGDQLRWDSKRNTALMEILTVLYPKGIKEACTRVISNGSCLRSTEAGRICPINRETKHQERNRALRGYEMHTDTA